MTTTGVFGVSAVAFNNAIVLHDGDLMASVFIHLTPTTAAWCFRWYREEHEKLWPGLFGIPIDHDFTFWEMFIPAMKIYMIWWVLNLSWLLTYAKKLGQPHYEQDTLFAWCAKNYPNFFKWAYNYDDTKPQANWPRIGFMLTHILYAGASCSIAYPLYHYYWAHCLYLIIIFSICAWNGANRYFKMMTIYYEKALEKKLGMKID